MRTRDDWTKTLAPRNCTRCKATLPLTRISFGWDIAGTPTLILGWDCATPDCGGSPVSIQSMRDGGIAISGAALTAERIEPPGREEKAAFAEYDAKSKAEAREWERAAAKKARAERRKMVKR